MREWAIHSWIWPCAAAYAIDLWLGDPRWLPHPVRGIGWLIRQLERILYGRRWQRAAGVALVVTTTGATVGIVALTLAIAARFGGWAHAGVATLLLWMAFATRGLIAHGEAVRRALSVGDLPASRGALARMVSRDVDRLEASGIVRACIESLAENLTDGCLSPLLFGLVGGPAAAWGLKAVSTLDSMVGYRNRRYRKFGWASARCDDIAHYLPARALWAILPAASWCVGASAAGCFTAMKRDGGRTDSPNSGLPEAGAAGALGIELGGRDCYQGAWVDKARLNAGARAPAAADIRRAQRLLVAASALPLLAAIPIGLL